MGINFQEVNYSYSKKKKNPRLILKNINLNIHEKDEFIALCGATGSGKSTLSLLMNAINIPSSGSLNIFGVEIKKKKKKKDKYNHLRQRVGLVFQFPEYQLFEESVIKDVMFALKNFNVKEEEAKIRASQTLVSLGIDESLHDRSPFLISGGQKKRVSLAGILVMNPDILILDEPTSGLDPKSRDELMALLKKLNEEEHKTIIFITHDMNLVNEYAKRVIVLKKGEIVFDNTPEELFKLDFNTIEDYHLDYPDNIKILKEIKEEFNLDIDVNQKGIEDSVKEVINHA